MNRVDGSDLRADVELFNINFAGLTVALVLAEILNVVQVFTPAHAVTVCYCCYCCSAASKQKMAKKRVKPENTWVFPGIFGYYPHWTLEIVVGHCQAFLIVVQPA